MCLTTLWPKKKLAALQKRSQTEPIRAWKVVRVGTLSSWSNHGGGLSILRGNNRRVMFKTNYQLNAARGKTINGPRIYVNGRAEQKFVYPAGFHAYANKEAGMRHGGSGIDRVIPVLLWDIVAAGKQSGCTVYVARKMMLLV